ncbi:hypothetical protein [Cellulomonas sp. Leaf334]|uniref:hypothetical protein n=1 Tax=Cellulomonas sp. Leaf334 TaxID=1736339 RepID=UPI0006F5742C|nr:hypothetical protein [Cellulomonas sp. Leaf334]KQR10454.1 hypothetical protein ASF78_17360 [Cellulomonas sp. Leaf334]
MSDRPEVDLHAFSDLGVFLRPDGPPDPRPYLGATVTASMFASVMAFVAPPFVEYRGGVFLGFACNRPVVDDWFDRLGVVADVERIVNHVHVWDLLPSRGFTEAEARGLVEPIASFWRIALRDAYPDRELVVQTDVDGSYGPELTFFQAAREGE